ncbi:MAG TPA: DUF222 domain-containing protein [Streptosporangiaceae bacterium]
MCPEPYAATPTSTGQALAMMQTALSFLAKTPPPAAEAGALAEVLTGLERAESQLTAARARALSGFCAGHGYEADGQYGPKPWLRAFTRVTKAAAAGAMAWMRRLDEHPAVAAALADQAISASWARELCGWTGQLPPERVTDADTILLAAAAGGADLADLADLAWQMIQRARVTPDGDDGTFADRAVWLETTLAGAGRLTGDLTPACATAVNTVLDALAAKGGPEDSRSLIQRRHDALEEACQRLIAAGTLPGRDGQPLHLYAQTDLAALREVPGRPEQEAAACDATVVPVVTGQVDWTAVDELSELLLPSPRGTDRQHLHDLLLRHAIGLLSGPSGLAGQLRRQGYGRPYDSNSQVLDLGTPTPVIPSHLRRAVTIRDRHCRFPGCTQPPSVCQIHHLRPRARGGPTALGNLAMLCRFHHLTVVHRWGWTLSRHPDGTTTATSPDGRTLSGNSPPRWAAR